MKPVILYRPHDGFDTTEECAMRQYFDVYRHRTEIRRGDLVIGRYSVLPFYRDLETDIHNMGGMLINSASEHEFIADVGAWAPILGDLTPETWSKMVDLPEEGVKFVVKGQTNSRKDRWQTHMFADNKQAAINVTLSLQEDSLIQTQKIYYREYVPLKNLGYGINGMPISEEWRIWLVDGLAIAHGFYWSSHVDDIKVPKFREDIIETAHEAAKKLLEANILPKFLVIGVARKDTEEPIVIELNDAQMSGLSETNPYELYKNLRDML